MLDLKTPETGMMERIVSVVCPALGKESVNKTDSWYEFWRETRSDYLPSSLGVSHV